MAPRSHRRGGREPGRAGARGGAQRRRRRGDGAGGGTGGNAPAGLDAMPSERMVAASTVGPGAARTATPPCDWEKRSGHDDQTTQADHAQKSWTLSNAASRWATPAHPIEPATCSVSGRENHLVATTLWVDLGAVKFSQSDMAPFARGLEIRDGEIFLDDELVGWVSGLEVGETVDLGRIYEALNKVPGYVVTTLRVSSP